MPRTIPGYDEQAAPATAGSPYAAGSPARATPNAALVREFEAFANDDASATVHRMARVAAIPIENADILANANRNLGPVFPDNAIIIGAFAEVLTAFASAGGGTIGLGFATDGATSIQASASAAGAPWSTTGMKTLTLAVSAATGAFLKLSAARQLLVTRAVAVLDAGAGRMIVYVLWVPGE